MGARSVGAAWHSMPQRALQEGLTMAARWTLFRACSLAKRPTTCSSGRSGAASHSQGCCKICAGVGRRAGSLCRPGAGGCVGQAQQGAEGG